MGVTEADRGRRERLRDLPPSAKLLHKVLSYEGGGLTQKQLAEETLLPARTVRCSVGYLEDESLIEKRISFRDARKKVISAKPLDSGQ